MVISESREIDLKAKTLLHNARIHTQSDGLTVNAMALYKGTIVAVGNNLEHDPDFARYDRINMQGRAIIPGLVDAHTHFGYYAASLAQVQLHGLDSIEACLRAIKKHAAKLGKREWVQGEGYTPDLFKKRIEPDRYMLDKVTDGRPALLFSKDQHTVCVNSKALDIAGITSRTPQPNGGEIVKDTSGEPNGLLREGPAYMRVFELIPKPTKARIDRAYKKVLQVAYENGVTGVHSFDGAEAFGYFSEFAEKGKLGLRINYYPPAQMLPQLKRANVKYGVTDGFLRIAGVKIFADGSLGSQTALCFNKYLGSRGQYGIETNTPAQIEKWVRSAATLGLPAAIHAIGDKANAMVLDVFEKVPALKSGARHRIEHMQLLRRKDIARVKRLGVVASMQPSHCPADIKMVRSYWGGRGKNAYIFKTLQDRCIDLAFGSDCPTEPLNPLHGIAAAVRRALPGSRDVFYPDQRLTAAEALYHYTVGPAIACGQDHCRGYLMPGYPADFVVLSDDITKIARSSIYDVKVLATVIDGKTVYTTRGVGV
jgi:predicted amidohydrolase YtcJ